MNTILFDYNREAFLPLTFTRPISDLRIGIVTIKEKWECYFDTVSVKTEDYLSEKFPIQLSDENLWINAQVLPNQELADEINTLQNGDVFMKADVPVAFLAEQFNAENLNKKEVSTDFTFIENIWEIFSLNGAEIKNDFERITKGRTSQKLDELSIKVGDYPLFIEEGAKVECAF